MIVARPQLTEKRVSRTTSIQAPTGGLNAKDPIANMKETEAVTMDNWFPTPSSVDIRNGFTASTTGFTAPIETLAAYNSTSPKQFAASNGNIYDASAAGAVGAAVVTGQGNDRWQFINIGTAGGFFLMMVNGEDKLLRYTGSAWQVDGDGSGDITGVDTRNIIHINNFKSRVWLIENNTMHAWYLPVASIAGAATKLDLSALFRLGGYLMTMANWTIDNSSGVDDYAAFITSEGEVALFKGTDPSSADAWAMVGTFRMGKPIGRRCTTKAGSDVLVITSDGAFPLSKALLTDRSQINLAATDKISNLMNSDVVAYRDVFGWQPILHPVGNKLIINVPTTENTIMHQYVMNTTHGAWCRFTGWNANCFETFNNELYFGGATAVYKADYGQDDNNSNITSVCQQAFSYFGSPGVIKKFTMARPIFLSDGTINPALLINVDFAQNRTSVAPSFTDNIGSPWDTSPWDTSPWTNGDEVVKRWQTITGVGYSGGIRVVAESKNLTCRWNSTDFVYEPGGVL